MSPYVCYLLDVARACVSVRDTESLRVSTFGDFVETACFSTCVICWMWRAPAAMSVLRNLYVSIRLVISSKRRVSVRVLFVGCGARLHLCPCYGIYHVLIRLVMSLKLHVGC